MAAVPPMAEKTMTAMATVTSGWAGAGRGAIATMGATMAEIRHFGAATQSHHQHNAVHLGNLLQLREANPRSMEVRPGAKVVPKRLSRAF